MIESFNTYVSGYCDRTWRESRQTRAAYERKVHNNSRIMAMLVERYGRSVRAWRAAQQDGLSFGQDAVITL